MPEDSPGNHHHPASNLAQTISWRTEIVQFAGRSPNGISTTGSSVGPASPDFYSLRKDSLHYMKTKTEGGLQSLLAQKVQWSPSVSEEEWLCIIQDNLGCEPQVCSRMNSATSCEKPANKCAGHIDIVNHPLGISSLSIVRVWSSMPCKAGPYPTAECRATARFIFILWDFEM